MITSAPAAAAPCANAPARPGELGPHVVADHDGLGLDDPNEGGAGAAREPLVDLVGHGAAHVVRLEDRSQGLAIDMHGHGVEPNAALVSPR